jgi:Cu-processing system ATP-binding protein
VSAEYAAQFTPATSVHRIDDHVAELICPEKDKMAVIRRIVAEGSGIADLEVAPPGLDELYAHFLGPQVEAR